MATDIRSLNPDDPDYDRQVEAALQEEDEADGRADPPAVVEEDEEGTTGTGEERTDPVDPPAVAATPAPSPAPTPAPTKAPAPADATPAPNDPPVGGVLGADGKTVLPYAALKGARQEAKEHRQARAAAEARVAELEAQLEAERAKGGGPTDEQRQRAEGGLLTDEERSEFPVLARMETAIKQLAKPSAAPAAPAPTPAPQSQAAEPTEDDVQEAIDSVPALAGWQASDPEKWSRAVAHDKVLRDSPKWKDKPLAERFVQVAKLVKQEFDEEVDPPPAPKPSPSPAPTAAPRRDPRQAAAAAPRNAPNTLSDFKGGAPDPSTDPIERLPALAQVQKFSEMSDADMDRYLARLG